MHVVYSSSATTDVLGEEWVDHIASRTDTEDKWVLIVSLATLGAHLCPYWLRVFSVALNCKVKHSLLVFVTEEAVDDEWCRSVTAFDY